MAKPNNELDNVYYQQGQHEQAIAEYKRAAELDPNNAVSRVGLAGVSRNIGDAEGPARYAAEARRLLKPDDHYNLACMESVFGDSEAALAHLAQALKQAPGLRAWARRDPDLAFIRDDPRFWALVGRDDDDA
jgi:tetratricopeptide (TPR) repeat protein